MNTNDKVAWIEVVQGVSGPSLYISDENGTGTRIAGPKPSGAWRMLYRFKVKVNETTRELRRSGVIDK